MSPEEEKNFNELLTTFDAMGLGQGDRVAGTNLLAAMASALANVSRTGSGIQSHGIGRLRAGASVLVTGSMSSSLVTDNVGAGYLNDTGLARPLRDAIGSTLYSGTSEIQKNIIAGWLGL